MNNLDKTILIIDDSTIDTELLYEGLKDEYNIIVSNSSNEAILLLEKFTPDLILLDIIMPKINGFDLFLKIKESNKSKTIPTIFLSSSEDIEDKAKAFEMGASDYLTKPYNLREIKLRVQKHLKDFSYISKIKRKISTQNNNMVEIYEQLFDNFISLIFFRDKETANHLVRTEKYMYTLISAYNKYYKTSKNLDEDKISKASILHDIGKIAIPDSILQKPGKLTESEFETMKKHTTVGNEILNFSNDIFILDTFKYARDIAYYHHEKWGGFGYPKGLKGDEIPLVARLMAVVDVYDALVSKRCYKDSVSHDEVMKYIFKNENNQFDPSILVVLDKIHLDFKEISIKFAD